MAVKEEFLNYIKDQLSELGEIETKKMFGGIGFFKQGFMFAMIGGDTFKLKVDESNKMDFEAKGMKPHHSTSKKKGMPYWEVPVDVLEDKSVLTQWAKNSYNIAAKNKK